MVSYVSNEKWTFASSILNMLTYLKSPVSSPNCSKNLSSCAPDLGCGGGGSGLEAAE